MKPRRIFHPTDFSFSAAAALRFALHAAGRFDAELHVGHVLPGNRGRGKVDTQDERADLETTMREYVGRELARLEAAERLAIEYHVIRDETPARGIVRFAEEHDMDVVVVGTHGRRGVRKLLLGSVALGVLHASRRDVVLVPNARARHSAAKLLVPLDLHERSGAVVALAGELAGRLSMPIQLLHVLDIPEEYRLNLEEIAVDNPTNLHDVTMERLAALGDQIDPRLGVATHASTGRPAAEILRHVAEHNVSLILMAASGMSPEERLRRYPHDGLSGHEVRWLVGRVAERVATHVDIPTWVVKRFEGEGEGSLLHDVSEGLLTINRL